MLPTKGETDQRQF